MSTHRISCLAVEFKSFYASEADDNPSGLFCRPPARSPTRGRRARKSKSQIYTAARLTLDAFSPHQVVHFIHSSRRVERRFDCRFRGELFQPFSETSPPANQRRLAGGPIYAYRVRRSLRPDEEHVPGPAPGLRTLLVVHLRAVAELIAVLIRAPRLLVVEAQARDIKRWKRVQLVRLADAVVVR